MSSEVLAPASPEQVAEIMRHSARVGSIVVPRGAGTKLDWGRPPSTVDLPLDLSRLDTVLEHAAGDLVVRVEAGVRLADLTKVLGPAGQRLAIDEVVPGSTIGGVISTGLSGPSRLLYGAVRDLLIGITVVRADGAVTHSGGKVVKNVAGYDLGKLYTGAFGTLGVITEAIFRLHPLPERTAWVSATLADEASAGTAVAAVLESQVVPSAVEVARDEPAGPVTVTVLLEGVAPGVEARAAAVTALLGRDATTADAPPPWWGTLPGPTIVKLTAEIAAVPRILIAVREAAAATALDVRVRGSAGVGVLYAGLADDAAPESVHQLITALRSACAAAGGGAVVLRAPLAIRAVVDMWGPVPGLALMRRLKDQFDPGHRLSPGRFVGGI